MKKAQITWGLALGGLLVAGLGAILLSSGKRSIPQGMDLLTNQDSLAVVEPLGGGELPQSRRVAEAVKPETVPVDAGLYGAPVGSTFLYSFKNSRSFRMVTKDQAGQLGELGENGRLRMTILARREGEVMVRLAFSDLTILGKAGRSQSGRNLDSLQDEISSYPVILRQGDDGRHLAFSFPQELAAEARVWVRTLVSGIQFVVADQSVGTWQEKEKDMAGSTLVRYFWEQKPEKTTAGRLLKEKVQVLELNGTNGLAFKPQVNGTYQAELGGSLHWFGGCRGEENWQVTLSTVHTVVHTKKTCSFALLEQAWKAPTGSPSWDGPWHELDGTKDGALIAKKAQLKQKAAQLKGVTIEDAGLEILRSAALGQSGYDALFEAREKMIWLLRLHPEKLAEVRKIVLQAAPESRGAAELLYTVGAADTGPAETFLGDFLVDNQMNDSLRTRSAMALFQISRPSGKIRQKVQGLVKGSNDKSLLRRTCLLLLGKLSQGGAGRLTDLLAMEKMANREGLLIDWLESLGNSRSAQVLGQVSPYLKSPDPQVRTAAVHALELAPGEEVTKELVKTLLAEKVLRVQYALVDSLSWRSGDYAMAAMRWVMTTNKDDSLRLRALEGLGDNKEEWAKRLLLQVITQDPSKRVRESAGKLQADLRR